MSKGTGGGKGGVKGGSTKGSGSAGGKGGGSNPNYPSTTGKPSGDRRGNTPK